MVSLLLGLLLSTRQGSNSRRKGQHAKRLTPYLFCRSVMLAPPLPMMLPAAAFDIRNLATCARFLCW